MMDLVLSSEGDLENAVVLFNRIVESTDFSQTPEEINIKIRVPTMFWAMCFTEFLNEAVVAFEDKKVDPENKLQVNVEVIPHVK